MLCGNAACIRRHSKVTNFGGCVLKTLVPERSPSACLLPQRAMPVTMSGSPSTTTSQMSDGMAMSSVRSGRLSPPPTKREAEQHTSWISVSRPFVLTKFDEHLELLKQHSEKEACRQKLLDKQAHEEELKATERARQKQAWRNRMQARENAVQHEREFRDNERKLQLQEWQQSVSTALEGQKARITAVNVFATTQTAAKEKNTYQQSILHFPSGNVKGSQEGSY